MRQRGKNDPFQIDFNSKKHGKFRPNDILVDLKGLYHHIKFVLCGKQLQEQSRSKNLTISPDKSNLKMPVFQN